MKAPFIFTILGISVLSSAQTVPVAKATEITEVPKIDGVLTEGEWKQAFKLEPFLDRVTAKESVDKTEAWIGYTKSAIYVAFYCHDTEPEKIIGREIIPNAQFIGEDQIQFFINSFGNRTFDSLSTFTVNSLGTQSEQIAGGRSSKREWRGEWNAKASRVADGWVCELEIPWKILNYPDKPSLNMDINFVRRQGRTLFEQSWANVRQNPLPELQGIWEAVNPPQAPKPKLQLMGYSAPEIEEGKARSRFGLDARYAFSPSFNGLASISPDFKNIEDVIAGIDFVRTERFLGERRPFFNEGGGFFRLSDDQGFGQMFYSRRIEEFDVGVKSYGQYTPTMGVGALFTSNFTGQKAAVLNVNKAVSAKENYNIYGTMNSEGGENNAFGFEYNKRIGLLGFNVGAASEKSEGNKADTAGNIGITYQGQNSFLTARYMWVSPEFSPTLGFIPWRDRRGGFFLGNRRFEFRKGPIRSIDVTANANEYRTYDGALQEGGMGLTIDTFFRNDIGFGFNRSRFSYLGSVDDTLTFGLAINATNRFKRFAVNYTEGTQNNVSSKFIAFGSSYRLLNNLDISIRQSILQLEGTSRQSIVSVGYQLSALDQITSRFSWTDAGSNAYLSYRHTGSRGTDLYLILGDPNAQKTTNRIALKLVWAS